MKAFIKLTWPVSITATLLLSQCAIAQQPAPPPDRDDTAAVEPMPNGPIHEAYAQQAPKNPEPGAIVAKKPPDPVPEEPPDRKPEGDNVQWIGGYWDWDKAANDFVWVSGFWRIPPPGRKWVAGYWQQVAGGWQRVPGYWGPADQEQPQIVPEPPPSLENGASVPAPDDNSFYIPGSWMYQGN